MMVTPGCDDDNHGNGHEDGTKVVDIRRVRRRSRRRQAKPARPRPTPTHPIASGDERRGRLGIFYTIGVGLKWLLVGLVVIALVYWALGQLSGLLPGAAGNGMLP